ncbi:MAG: extracellular solute-binding protein [Deltaproteobacteria bacterium]|nr:extracellular solute-binding protein [Deltaproteobacteria bacterium]
MKRSFIREAALFLVLVVLGPWAASSSLLAAPSDPALLKAKAEAEAQGYIFLTSHDEIVAGAKKEGKLRALSLLASHAYKALIDAFKKRYPFISDLSLEEIGATEAPQRLLLELQSGRPTEWDALSVAPDFYPEYAPHVKRFDILGMAQQKVLAIPTAMVDPKNRIAVSIASSAHAIGYNRKLIPEDKLPKSWEDFLKPEFKGKKFLVDIRPIGFAALAAGLGEKWAVDYARKIAAQEPVWVRGQSRYLNTVAAGEHALFHLAFHYSCERAAKRDATGSLGCKVIEPVPARIQNFQVVNNAARHPYSSLLWLEFLASPEGQRIIDEYEPFNTSLYSPDSKLAKLIQGKKLSVNNWNTIHNSARWERMVVEAFGFPKAGK